MLRVVVADDEARVCQLILMLADWDSLGMEVVGTAGNGLEALELVERLHPDILVTDIRMPGCHGLELIQRAKEKFPQLEIVIISGYAHFEFAQTAIKYGVGDYLLKPIKREELMSTLEKLGQRCRQRACSAVEMERLRQANRETVDQLRIRLPLDLLGQRLEAVRKHLRGCLDQLLAQRTIFGPLEFSLALGPTADRVEDLPGCAQAARWAAADRLIQGTGRLLEGGPYPSELDRDQLLEQYRRTMERGMESARPELLDQAADDLARAVRNTPGAHGWEVLELAAGAGRLFLLRPELEDRERLQQRFESDCDRCGQWERLFQYLKRIQREQIQAIRERRRSDAIRPVREAKQYVQQHYSQPITLEDVCDMVGFTPSYFSALFKKETGEGFAKYLTRVRMERAKELLQRTNLPVAEICVQVGYSDVKHFTQNFKKETNLNPGQYRKLYG